MNSVPSTPECAVLMWHHSKVHQWKSCQVRTTVSKYSKNPFCQCSPCTATPHFAFKTFASYGLSTLGCFPKMADIALAIQYKCQVLRNAFSTLNTTEKERLLNFQLFTLCFLELLVFSINSLNVLISKILLLPWQ